MPKYLYTAQSADGTTKKGTATADNEKELAGKLQKDSLTLVSASPVDEKNGQNRFSFFDKLTKVTLVDKMFFTQNLQVMVRTGFSVARALKTLALQTRNKRFATTITMLREDVEQGQTLATSMRKFPDIFSPIFINMIEAGEISGQLENVLARLTIQMKKDHALISKVKSALTYPAVILVAVVGIGIAMLIFVIPKITSLYTESNVQLPFATRALIKVSDLAANNSILFLGGLALIAFGVYRFLKTSSGRRIFHAILLKAPIAGRIVQKINLARFTRTLSSLLKTDIPIVQTFQVIAKTMGNVYYQQVMLEVADKVKQGQTVTSVLDQYPKLFPPVVTQIIDVGEQSGTLDTIAEEIAIFYEDEVEQTMAGLSTIIEPVLMLILGAGVGMMAIAIIMPMYNLVEAF